MSAILHTPPAIEPVSLSQVKNHLKIETSADDDLILRLVSTARQYVERVSQHVLIEQVWRVYFNHWPEDNELALPVMPVSFIEALRTYSAQDDVSEIDPSHYYADLVSTPPKLVLRHSRSWMNSSRPANGIEIELTAGYGPLASDVPAPFCQAILLLTAHWYENRNASCAQSLQQDIGKEVQRLLQPYKVARL